jgi:hypothetical protein
MKGIIWKEEHERKFRRRRSFRKAGREVLLLQYPYKHESGGTRICNFYKFLVGTLWFAAICALRSDKLS